MVLDVSMIFVAFALGGILKGATGAGAPIIAVPVTAMIFGPHIAIILFAVPNLASNLWQSWKYREFQLPPGFTYVFAIGGAVGTLIGTEVMINLPSNALTLVVAFAVLIYVAFRLAKPSWVLGYEAANKFAVPVGFLGGMLFGTTALSAPVTLSFLNAMKLDRTVFIATVTCFFMAMGLVQVPLLIMHGLMDTKWFLLSSTALIPILCFMPVGAWLTRHISREMFDRIILAFLVLLSLKLIYQSFNFA